MHNGFSEATVEEIKARVDIADLIASYGVQVRSAGSTLKACCPFHQEKTPSFVINRAKGFYHCFGCGVSGDAITFVEKMEGVSFPEAVKKLAAQCGVAIEEKDDPEAGTRKRLYALMGELALFYQACLFKSKAAEGARQYLRTRALDRKICADFLIGYAPEGIATLLDWAKKRGYTPEELETAGVIRRGERPGDAGYHRFAGRLMFAVRDKRGRVVAFSGRLLAEKKNAGKYVNSPETPIFRKSNVLYAFDKAAANIAKSTHREAIVCEGQIDTIRFHASGFPVAVASQGTAFTEEHVKLLKTVADAVVLVFDDDAAGHKATIRTARLFLAAGLPVRTVSLPGGHDPDSFLRQEGAEAFRKLLDGAQSIVAFQYRAGRLAEKSPDSIDAVARLSRGLIETLAACSSAVLRASLAGEAAKLLGVPAAALADDLARAEAARRPRKSRTEKAGGPAASEPEAEEEASEEAESAPMPGEDAARAQPPPQVERAFLGFLLSADSAEDVLREVTELLPADVLSHELSRQVFAHWQATFAAPEEDALAAYVRTLDPRRRGWFDAAFAEGPHTDASVLAPLELAQGFIRSLWVAYLTRRRGELPARDEDEATVRERLALTLAISLIRTKPWPAARAKIAAQIQDLQAKEGEKATWT